MTEIMANGYSSDRTRRELFYEYKHDRVKMIFIYFCFFEHYTKVTSAAEGFKEHGHVYCSFTTLASTTVCSQHCFNAIFRLFNLIRLEHASMKYI